MLFQWGKFTSAAGIDLSWKIECDALSDEDWECIALAAVPRLGHFNRVFGVPRGGLKLANALQPYRVQNVNSCLVVDDVWTTGKSMLEFAARIEPNPNLWRGFVAFARGRLSRNVTCFANISV